MKAFTFTITCWLGLVAISPLCADEPKLVATFKGHQSEVTRVLFSNDGTILASVSARDLFSTSGKDGVIKLWAMPAGKEIASLAGAVSARTSPAFSPDNRILAFLPRDKSNAVALWEIASRQVRAVLQVPNKDAVGLSFSPDSRRFATVGANPSELAVWNISDGKELVRRAGPRLRGHFVAFNCDGTRLAAAGMEDVKLWDTSSWQLLSSIPLKLADGSFAAFSPDGKLFAASTQDKMVKVWDAFNGKEITTLHTGPAYDGSFSADSQRFASAGQDKTVRLWDVWSGKQVATMLGHKGRVFHVAFSSDGKRLASSSEDKTIKLWDPHTGKELATLTGHTNWVLGLAFSPDSKWLASAGRDKTVRLWDVSSAGR